MRAWPGDPPPRPQKHSPPPSIDAKGKKAIKTHSAATHAVTASPAARQAAGSLSFFLHSMNAADGPEQETAMCLDAAMRTAVTGGAGGDEDAGASPMVVCVLAKKER
jgi:hypothetical protein